MNCTRLAAPFLALVAASLSFAADFVAPDSNLKAEGIPPIPATLAAKVAPYTEFKPATIVSWHPEKRELIVARRAGNVTQLHRVAAPGSELEYFGEGGDWDVEDIALSPDGHTLAVITNEAGVGVLRLYDADTRRALTRPQLPVGTVGRPAWHQNSRDLAVTVASAQSPSDAYTVDVRNNRVERWTEDKVTGLDASSFRSMEPIAWKSFDGRVINGFLALPPARFTGKRPVIVMIHGGPEGQAAPGFSAAGTTSSTSSASH